MSGFSRRLFLANSAGLAAAGAAVAALPSVASVLPGTAATAVDDAPATAAEISAAGPLVVHVADAAAEVQELEVGRAPQPTPDEIE